MFQAKIVKYSLISAFFLLLLAIFKTTHLFEKKGI